jgi:hypothetical protein
MRTRIIIATIAAVCVAIILSIFLFRSPQKTTKVHKLEYRLLLSSDNPSKNMHMLPKGTVMYFDQSYPEGFTRYKVYINVDRMPLSLVELSDPTSILPIDANAPDKEDLKKLLKDYPVTKADLNAILKSTAMSKEEIKEVLTDFLR